MPKPPGTLATRRPPDAFLSQLSANPQDQMRQVAEALSRKADVTTAPAYVAIILMDPSGIQWRVSVDTVGNLQTVMVPP